jgi:hypothetical protein
MIGPAGVLRIFFDEPANNFACFSPRCEGFLEFSLISKQICLIIQSGDA